jgi:hypothetical protein
MTTRRNFIAGLAIMPALASTAAPVIANEGDAVIEAAFARRQAAYATYNALPPDSGPVVNGYGPGERDLWDIIDEAEEVIRSHVATTPRGAMLQLWCAMYHSVSGREDDETITRGDFGAIARLDGALDWNVRLMLAALRSLQTMEA